MAGTLRQLVREVDPRVEIWTTLPMAAYVEAAVLPQRIASSLLGLLSGLALLLAMMGVYAVVAYSVSQRTREFGVRNALGAAPRDVWRLVVRDGLVLALRGGAAGVAGALVLTRLLTTFLFGVSPFDPTAFAGVPLALLSVALVATWAPARRAMRVNPVEALRAE